MVRQVTPEQKFPFSEVRIFRITISIPWMSRFARATHGLAEVRQNPSTDIRSRNVAPNLKNLRVAMLIVHNERLRSVIVTFNIDSPIAGHEVDRNTAISRRDDHGR